jgi:hypothetical protein
MKTLGDAWTWYESTRRNLERMNRLGKKHWSDPSLENASIWLDNEFKLLEEQDIVAETETGLKPLDDLAIVVLFSVFEALVRGALVELIKPEADKLSDPILREPSRMLLVIKSESLRWKKPFCRRSTVRPRMTPRG